jgi:hypothetical protein
MAAGTPILIFHKAGVWLPGTWFLAPDTCKRPPSAHPFSRASAGALPWAVSLGLVAQLVRARA